MNWVGGARNRLKTKSDIKKQGEFFQKRKQEIANNSKKRDSHNTPRLSRDLLTFNLLKIKSRKIYKEAKPTKVIKQDLEKFNTAKTSHVNLPETPIAFDNYSSKIKEKTKFNSEIYRSEEVENVDDIFLIKGNLVRRNNCSNVSENTHPLQMPSESDVQCRKQNSSFVPFHAENNSLIEFAAGDDKESDFKQKYQNNKDYKSYKANSQDEPFTQPLSELFNSKHGVGSIQPLNEFLNTKEDVAFVQPLNELLNTTYGENIDSFAEPHPKRDCTQNEIFSIFDSSAKHKQSSTKLAPKNRRNLNENVNYPFARDNFGVHSPQKRTTLIEDSGICYDTNNKESCKSYDIEEIENYLNVGNSCAPKFDDATIFIDKEALTMSRNCFENNYPKPGASEAFRVSDFMENCDFVRKTNDRNNMVKDKSIMYRNLNPEIASFLNTSSVEAYGRKKNAFKFSRENVDTEYENEDLEDYSIFQEQICLIKQSKTRIHPDMLSRQFYTSDFDIKQTNNNTGFKRKRNHDSGFDTYQQNISFDNLNDDIEEEHSFNVVGLKNNSQESLKTQSIPHCMDVENSNGSLFTGAMESPEPPGDETYFEKTRLPCYNSPSMIPYVFSDSNQTFNNINRHRKHQNYRDDAISKNASKSYLPMFLNSTAKMYPFSNRPHHERTDKASKTEKYKYKLAPMNSKFALDLDPTYPFIARNENITNVESQKLKKNNKAVSKTTNNSNIDIGKSIFDNKVFGADTYENRVFQENYQNDNMDLPTTKCSKQHDVISKTALLNNEILNDKDFEDYNINRYNAVYHSTPFANILETLKITDTFSESDDYSKKCSTLPETGINSKSKKLKYLRKNETMTPSTDYEKVLKVKCKMDNTPVYDYSENLNLESNVIDTSIKNTLAKTQFNQECSEQLKNNDDVQGYSILVESEQSKVKSEFTESLNESALEVLKTHNEHLQPEDYSTKCLELPETKNNLLPKVIKNAGDKEFMTSETTSIGIGYMKFLSANYENDSTFPYNDSENFCLRNNVINSSTKTALEKPKLTKKCIEQSHNQDDIKKRLRLGEIDQLKNKKGLIKDLNETTFEALKINDERLQTEDHSKKCLELPETENNLVSKEIKNTREKEFMTSETASIGFGYINNLSAKYKNDSTVSYDDSENLNLGSNFFNSSTKIALKKPKLVEKCIEHSHNQDNIKKRLKLGEIDQLKNKRGFIKDLNETTSEALKINDGRLRTKDYSMETSVFSETENNSISKGMKNAPEKEIMTLCTDYMKVFSLKRNKENTSIYNDSKGLDKSLNFENNFINSSIKVDLENLKCKKDCFKKLEINGDDKECSILGESEQLKNKSDKTQALNENTSEVLELNDELLQTEDFTKKSPVLSETENNLKPKEIKNSHEKEISSPWSDCIKVLSVKYKKDNISIYDDSKTMGKSLNFERKIISSTKCVYEKSTLIEECLQHQQNNDEFKKCSILGEASQRNDKGDLNESALDAILNCEVIIKTDEESEKDTNSSVLEEKVYSSKQDDQEKPVTQVIKCNEQSIPNSGECSEYEENKSSQLDVITSETEESSIDQLSTKSSDSQCSKSMVSAKGLDYEITKVCTLPDETDYLTGIHISYKNLLNSHNDHFYPESTKYEKSSFNTLEVGTQTVIETFDFGCQVSL